MALMQPSSLTPDEQRTADLDDAFSGTKAKVEGFKPVRRVTALVVDILRRRNNFFITGKKGFEEIGIQPGKLLAVMLPSFDAGKGKPRKPNPEFDPEKAGAVVPKIAEVIALLTCSEDALDECDDNPARLNALRREVMRASPDEIMAAMADVQSEFEKINKSTAVVEEEPTTGGEVEAKKKHGQASVPVM